jgi:hypothetical protein
MRFTPERSQAASVDWRSVNDRMRTCDAMPNCIVELALKTGIVRLREPALSDFPRLRCQAPWDG